MAFPENFIDELVERNDIVDVVGSYVRLTKRSGANYFGLCPFHNERTPSFAVNPAGQFYHCFGCGKGGGVINFIMEIENLSFPEAVENLARRAGMQLPEEGDEREAKVKSRLLSLNRDSARFFYDQLATPEGRKAIAYMEQRNISPATAKKFGLGFAPERWDSLLHAMREKGYNDRELFEAGLIRKGKQSGFYDTFRNRLMFPVIDVRGDVIGFSGRILSDDGPKYMNSPESPVFNKSRNLFALNIAKKTKSGYLLLTEGNIDVVSLHQAGFDSAVASLGTSLTPEQARLISRYTKQVILAYDNDTAGEKASQRAIGILEKLDLKVKVLRLTGAKDPDEYIRARGADAFRKLLEGSEDQLDYRLNSVTMKYDLSRDEDKLAFLKEATEMIASLPGQVERQVYAIRAAHLAGIGQDAVISEVERRRKRKLDRARSQEERSSSRPERTIQPQSRELRYQNPVSAAAEEGIIRLLYLEPSLNTGGELPDATEFSSSALSKIYSILRERISAGESIHLNSFTAFLNQDEMNLLVSLLQKPEQLTDPARSLYDYIQRIREERERTGQGEEIDLRRLSDQLRERKGYRQ